MKCFPLKGETCFGILKNHFEKDFVVAIYFILFLKEKKLRKKTLNVTHNRKNKYVKIESRFGGQVTY